MTPLWDFVTGTEAAAHSSNSRKAPVSPSFGAPKTPFRLLLAYHKNNGFNLE